MTRRQVIRDVAGQYQATHGDHDLACDVVNARLADALNDLLDIAQRLGCFLWTDAGHDPIRVLATSSATAATALALPTMPM